MQSDDLALWWGGEGVVRVATVFWLVELGRRRVLALTASLAFVEISRAQSGPWRAEGASETSMRSDQQAHRWESGLSRETVGVVRAQMMTEYGRGKYFDWKIVGERGPRAMGAMSCFVAGRDAQVCK